MLLGLEFLSVSFSMSYPSSSCLAHPLWAMLCGQKSAYLQKFNDIMYVLVSKAYKMLQRRIQIYIFGESPCSFSIYSSTARHRNLLFYHWSSQAERGQFMLSVATSLHNELVGPSVIVPCMTPSLMPPPRPPFSSFSDSSPMQINRSEQLSHKI